MKILVINAGSTSLKYQLIDSESEAVLAKGLCERIGTEGSEIKYDSSKTGEQGTEDKRYLCQSATILGIQFRNH